MLLMPLHGPVVAEHHLPQCLAQVAQAGDVAVLSDVLWTRRETEMLKKRARQQDRETDWLADTQTACQGAKQTDRQRDSQRDRQRERVALTGTQMHRGTDRGTADASKTDADLQTVLQPERQNSVCA